MALNLDAVGKQTTPRVLTWDSKDSLLYALGVGAGHNPTQELEFTTENTAGTSQRALPTMPVALSGGPEIPLGTFSMSQVLHAEQSVTNYREFPVSGSLHRSSKVVDMLDKGKDAIIILQTQFTDIASGELVSQTSSGIFVRGEGGFGGERGEAVEWDRPNRQPDTIVEYATRPEQALIYRLSGDRNPLHSDPQFAKQAGLNQPILHGLCTYGFAGRALLQLVSGDSSRFQHMSARFAAPVLPGEQLQINVWNMGNGRHHFEVDAAGRTVLGRGVFIEGE